MLMLLLRRALKEQGNRCISWEPTCSVKPGLPTCNRDRDTEHAIYKLEPDLSRIDYVHSINGCPLDMDLTSNMSGSLKPPGPANLDRPTVLSCKGNARQCQGSSPEFHAHAEADMICVTDARLRGSHTRHRSMLSQLGPTSPVVRHELAICRRIPYILSMGMVSM